MPHERRAAIYSKATVTPYPFQANTYGLPPDVVKECVIGFVESMQAAPNARPTNFHDWALRTFGWGIAKHFMLPYNEKFWKQDLRTITTDWGSWSIPKPTLEEVVNGALGLTNKGMGYNPKFIYPKNGGIDCLPQALARNLRCIRTKEKVRYIDPQKKYVRLAGGGEEPYDFLVSTLPLPLVYRMLKGVPDTLVAAARTTPRDLRAEYQSRNQQTEHQRPALDLLPRESVRFFTSWFSDEFLEIGRAGWDKLDLRRNHASPR